MRYRVKLIESNPVRAKRRFRCFLQITIARKYLYVREFPEVRVHDTCWSLTKEERSAVSRDEGHEAASGNCGTLGLFRKLVHPALAQGDTLRRDRAVRALRIARGADQCPQF